MGRSTNSEAGRNKFAVPKKCKKIEPVLKDKKIGNKKNVNKNTALHKKIGMAYGRLDMHKNVIQ